MHQSGDTFCDLRVISSGSSAYPPFCARDKTKVSARESTARFRSKLANRNFLFFSKMSLTNFFFKIVSVYQQPHFCLERFRNLKAPIWECRWVPLGETRNPRLISERLCHLGGAPAPARCAVPAPKRSATAQGGRRSGGSEGAHAGHPRFAPGAHPLPGEFLPGI